MKRHFVVSRSMTSVGYDPGKKIMEVEFPTGKVYDYFKVPVFKYKAMLRASSIGFYFNLFIKPFYTYKQVK